MTKLSMPQTPINIEKPASNFLEHLTTNNRILFSGAFGIGKTFFLKHFFETQEIKEKYNVFHLFPVNYQIATNEDIFELIKYDILYHLLSFDWITIDNEKFSKSLAFQSYFLNDSINIASKILKCIPVLDKVGNIVETISNISKEAKEYKEKINQNEAVLLKEFGAELKKKKGSIYEFDAISEFINNSLTNCNNKIKEKKQHKENVLIIDDLDRIDPEHIFRLLNVFSAHIDRGGETNKFGFDKIIFVCDVENIRNIFAAKYGQQTDFSGYIDKFYSSEIFHFNNKDAICNFVGEVMRSNLNRCQEKQNNFYRNEIRYITDILILFVDSKAINLRQIFSNVEVLKNKKTQMGFVKDGYYSLGYTIIWTCLRILGGRKETLIDAFRKASSTHNNEYYKNFDIEAMACEILPLLSSSIYSRVQEGATCEFVKENIKIIFKLNSRGIDSTYRPVDIITATHILPETIAHETLCTLFIAATNELDKRGFLN